MERQADGGDHKYKKIGKACLTGLHLNQVFKLIGRCMETPRALHSLPAAAGWSRAPPPHLWDGPCLHLWSTTPFQDRLQASSGTDIIRGWFSTPAQTEWWDCSPKAGKATSVSVGPASSTPLGQMTKDKLLPLPSQVPPFQSRTHTSKTPTVLWQSGHAQYQGRFWLKVKKKKKKLCIMLALLLILCLWLTEQVVDVPESAHRV